MFENKATILRLMTTDSFTRFVRSLVDNNIIHIKQKHKRILSLREISQLTSYSKNIENSILENGDHCGKLGINDSFYGTNMRLLYTHWCEAKIDPE